MLLLALVGIAVAAVPLFRGRVRRLAELPFRAIWLIIVALGIQFLILTIMPGPRTTIREGALVGSYLMGIGFLLLNRRIPGMWLIGIGAAMNFVAIAANGGVMPAAPHALATAGLPIGTPDFYTNSVAVAAPRFAYLGDIFALPASWPLSNVFSAGDVLIAVGAVVTVHRATGSRLVPSGAGQFSQLLTHRSFVRTWGAQAVSNLGDWVYALAVAATLSQHVGGPALARTLSILLVAQVAPAAVCGTLFAGPLADRYSRRNLMVLADVVRGVAVGSLLLSPSPSPAHFYAVGACLGLCGAIFQPSLMASIPNVVDEGQVVAANAMVAATFHIAIMVGPALGAFLVASVGFGPVFALNAASFLLSAVLIVGVRLPKPGAKHGSAASVRRDLIEGARYITSSPLVRGVLVVMGIVLLAAATKTPLETLFVRDVLTKGTSLAARARALGLVTTAWGLGMVLGSIGAPALARRWPRERLLRVAITVVGVAVLVVSRTTDFSTVLLAWLLAGTANSVGNISYESLLQERTPDPMRGRVFAATEAVLNGSYLAGAFMAGFLASWVNVSGGLAIAGGILLFAAALSRVLLPGPARMELVAPSGDPGSP